MAVAEAPAAQWAVVEVALNEIVVDRALNPRLEIDQETVQHYTDIYEQLPPVEAFDTERGRVLVDGWHRHGAAKALRLERIRVRVRTGTYREAMEYAALVNVRHGRPLTSRERRRVTETLLLLHAEWSDEVISRTVGCSRPTVGSARRGLEGQGRIPKIEHRLGANGIVKPVLAAPEKFTGSPNDDPEPEPKPTDPWAGMVLEGDAFEQLAAIEDASVDLLLLDPPYGILAGQGLEWDAFESADALMAFTRRWIEAVLPKLKPTGRLFCCFSQVHLHRLRTVLDEYAAPDQFDLVYSNTLIWHYKNILSQPNNRSELKLAHEPVLHYRARYAPSLDFSVYGEEQGDVWTIATPQSNFNEGKHHPAQKPLELVRRIISLACPADGVVLDPFAGSGTTGVAAYELGRAFRLIERKPEYITTARERLDAAKATADAAAPQLELGDAAGD